MDYDKRRTLFESFCNARGKRSPLEAGFAARFTCPCCGYPTLGSRAHYEICKICWWEDDGQDEHDADVVRGGPNHHYSLAAAQRNFARYLVVYPPDEDTRVGGADSREEAELKRELIASFEAMLYNPPVHEIRRLWVRVVALEQALRECRGARIRGYVHHAARPN